MQYSYPSKLNQLSWPVSRAAALIMTLRIVVVISAPSAKLCQQGGAAPSFNRKYKTGKKKNHLFLTHTYTHTHTWAAIRVTLATTEDTLPQSLTESLAYV